MATNGFKTQSVLLIAQTEVALRVAVCSLKRFAEPAIRWYRNNEPVRKSQAYEISQNNGEATLKISSTQQEDVAEYKIEASNPAGKASSVANIVLTRTLFHLTLYLNLFS